ncbi:MAG: HDOD domain-containing protein [Armatimonadetes bacterium]|nr:HDOD domain-containing protein [Armatimonadota bacterium]
MALRSENFLLRRYIEKAMVDLPALPGVVLQVVQATENENVSTAEIEKHLSLDTAITTKLLKVVNSAYFGLPRQIVNVNQTIAILGLHQVRNLVLSIGVLNILTSSSPRVIETQKAYWQNSFAAASCAEMLAKKKSLERKDVETVFVSGLLRDVGRLFLFTLFTLPYQEVLGASIKNEEPISETETRILGFTHAELGATLAEKWNFPQILVDAIRDHDRIPEGNVSPTTACIHVADHLAGELSDPAFVGVIDQIDPRALRLLGIAPADLDSLRESTVEQVAKAKELVGLL